MPTILSSSNGTVPGTMLLNFLPFAYWSGEADTKHLTIWFCCMTRTYVMNSCMNSRYAKTIACFPKVYLMAHCCIISKRTWES